MSAQSSAFRQGIISDHINPVIANERVSSVPFKDGVVIFSVERNSSFIYYFDGEQPPVFVGETNPYVVSVGPVPGGHVISSSGIGERILQFVSEDDFSLTTLDNPYGNRTPVSVVLPNFILQFTTLPSDTLVIIRLDGQPAGSTEILRVRASNSSNPSYRVLNGKVIISSAGGLITDGTVDGTFSLPNQAGLTPFSVHFFNGEYYYWDQVLDELVAIDPITRNVRRVMGPEFPSGLKPLRITDMTVTPAGIVYVASTDE